LRARSLLSRQRQEGIGQNGHDKTCGFQRTEPCPREFDPLTWFKLVETPQNGPVKHNEGVTIIGPNEADAPLRSVPRLNASTLAFFFYEVAHNAPFRLVRGASEAELIPASRVLDCVSWKLRRFSRHLYSQ